MGTTARSWKSRIANASWPWRVAELAPLVEQLHDERGRGQGQADPGDRGGAPWEPGEERRARDRGGGDDDLERAEPEDVAAQLDEPARIELEADEEQEQHHAELGDVEDGLGVAREREPVRTRRSPRDEVAEDGAQAEARRERHDHHGRREVDERRAQERHEGHLRGGRRPGSLAAHSARSAPRMTPMARTRVGILTGGGDVPGLNSVIKSVVYRAADHDIEVLGLRRGWEGLTHLDLDDPASRARYVRPLTRENTRTIDRTGGTFLHSSRTNPSKMKKLPPHLEGRASRRAQTTKGGVTPRPSTTSRARCSRTSRRSRSTTSSPSAATTRSPTRRGCTTSARR